MVSNQETNFQSRFLSAAKTIAGGRVILEKSPNMGGFGDILGFGLARWEGITVQGQQYLVDEHSSPHLILKPVRLRTTC